MAHEQLTKRVALHLKEVDRLQRARDEAQELVSLRELGLKSAFKRPPPVLERQLFVLPPHHLPIAQQSALMQAARKLHVRSAVAHPVEQGPLTRQRARALMDTATHQREFPQPQQSKRYSDRVAQMMELQRRRAMNDYSVKAPKREIVPMSKRPVAEPLAPARMNLDGSPITAPPPKPRPPAPEEPEKPPPRPLSKGREAARARSAPSHRGPGLSPHITRRSFSIKEFKIPPARAHRLKPFPGVVR